MKYSIIISCNPNTESSNQAFEFIKSLLATNNQILIIFFQGDGVYHALNSEWLNLTKNQNINLVNCSTASIKRNLTIDNNSNIKISGLGELIMAIKNSDKVIKF